MSASACVGDRDAADLVLYVLGRTDIASMTGGMFAAHAAHAQRHADHEIKDAGSFGGKWREHYLAWCAQTPQGFGTTLALDAGNLESMRRLVAEAGTSGFPAGTVVDPTYPVRDGSFAHLVRAETCGWAFGHRSGLASVLGDVPLRG